MARIRVHELAKELNVSNKDLLDRIARLGVQVKNHMSTLSDLAVQRIRQHFVDSKAEEVEQKRIGRTVIRRRKRISPEETVPGQEAEGFPQVAPEGEVPVRAGLSEPAVAVEEEDLHLAPSQAVAEAEAEVEAPPSSPQFHEETAPQETALKEVAKKSHEAVAEAAAGAVQPEPMVEGLIREEMQPHEMRPAETVEPEATMGEVAPVVPSEEEPSERVEAEQPAMVRPEPEKPEAPAEKVLETKTRPIAAVEARVEAPVQAEPAAPERAADEEEGEKPKKTKKRRRKKSHRDEPARIISLPEIIPEETEEEPEILAVVPPRLQVITEEVESKDAARKKRPKHEEFQREAPGRRWRGPGRREVVEREDLYSKKELAAQADRARDRDRYDRGAASREAAKPEPVAPKVGRRKIRIDEAITIANLAKSMGVKAGEVIKKLLVLGLPANINQAVDFDTASIIASEFDFEVEKVGFEEEDVLQTQQQDRPEDLQPRPPVVTVMGHVDHGKTSLLDAIRHTNVIGGEAGGITQHIGAYYVKLGSGDVVFLDTPGHEAFTAMRARGSKVTDIVILVVAADDGVMQQTIEAINHSKAAGVPIVVAINKVDKPNANIDRVKRELAEQGLLPEEWGGDTTMVELSAKKKMGIEELLEMVLLQAELMELKANPSKPARGRVIEAKLDRGRGPVASILIQEGTLKTGDAYVCGVQYGRVRNMFNDRGQRLDKAGPSTPVEVLGLSGVPNAGDDFTAVADERNAKMVAEHRMLKLREKELSKTSKVTLESLFEQIQEGEVKELNVILKTDVQGSLEAISDSLVKLSTPEVKVNLIHSTTGAITETDVMLASASNAIVIGFNVRADGKVQELADQEQVDVRYYDVIYQIISDIKDAMVGMLEPIYKENVIGRAEVRKVFHVPKVGTIAGCYVLDGRVERGARARVLREQVVVYEGKIVSLKRLKDDIKEARAGFECGINIENFNDVKVDDVIEAFEMLEIKPTLETTESARE